MLSTCSIASLFQNRNLPEPYGAAFPFRTDVVEARIYVPAALSSWRKSSAESLVSSAATASIRARDRMGGASKYLTNLPSRGLFSSTVPSSSPGGIRVYICDHDTEPPEDQLIKTNTTNILIRSLQLNKQKGELKDSKSKSASSRGKRSAEGTSDGRIHSKRANTASTSGSSKQGGSSACPSQKELQAFTVERLRALLKEKGLSAKGKKDELISRLKEDQSK